MSNQVGGTGKMDVEPLRVAGFGACMISGYPHKSGGLFEVACSVLKKSTSRPVDCILVSLGGFGAPRAQKYLAQKILKFRPHYVVLQFGSTDAQCPIRKSNRLTATRSETNEPSTSISSWTSGAALVQAAMLSYFRWEVASLIGAIRKLEPITPISLYTDAIKLMISGCKLEGATPVVLSPFIYGPRRTARTAASYVNALYELHSKETDMILVDCVEQLTRFQKKLILQQDGFHLSRLGHELVGHQIGEAIVADLARHSASSTLIS
jgi:hypothetical protein